MTKKKRVIDALNHKETDIIPYYVGFTEQAKKKMILHTGDSEYCEKIGNHLHYIEYWGWPTERVDRPGYFVDAFGVEWNRAGIDKDIGVITCPVITDIVNSTYRCPEPDEKRIKVDMENMLLHASDRFTMGAIGFSVFERAWSLLSMEEVFVSMVAEPNALDRLLDDICEHNLKVMDIMLSYPINGFFFGDDWGQQKGLMMGKVNWQRFIKPIMKKLYGRAKQANKYVFQHSCGDILEIFPDLIEIGLDCYQTFQPEIYDIETIKKEYGMDLSFWGGISTQQILPYASSEKVRQETARIMCIMGKGGGYIAAPTHALTGDVPPENMLAMFDVFKNQHQYI